MSVVYEGFGKWYWQFDVEMCVGFIFRIYFYFLGLIVFINCFYLNYIISL